MKTVFIGGSRDVTRFNPVIEERLHAILDAGLPVLVGDANGADKAVQRWFATKGYPRVTVFHSGDSPRSNLGHWTTRRIVPKTKKKDFHFHAAKDLAMAETADYGFMLWDGRSKDIRPLYLPPYSPDFNPIERFWIARKPSVPCAIPIPNNGNYFWQRVYMQTS